MLITDFTMAETGISHYLPQLMGALVMPVLAFVSLLWIDWRMAVAMFVALPFAMGILWLSTSVQERLSGRQIKAKVNAGNRLEEYLQGILAFHCHSRYFIYRSVHGSVKLCVTFRIACLRLFYKGG